MNPQVKQKWVDALRSGEYEQGTGKLKSQQGFCCLGVLCDLYAEENRNTCWKYRGPDKPSDPTDYWYFDGQSEFLPESVARWAGLENQTFYVKVLGENYCYDNEDEEDVYFEIDIDVAELNDNGGTFKRIADLIEESP